VACTAATKLSCRKFPANATTMVLLRKEASDRKADVLIVGDELTLFTDSEGARRFEAAWRAALAAGKLSGLQKQYLKAP
jgi:hypothetical protein